MIGEYLKSYIAMKDMSLRQFAKSLDMGHAQISRYMSGENTPGLRIIKRIQKKYPDFDPPYQKIPNTAVAEAQISTSPDKLIEAKDQEIAALKQQLKIETRFQNIEQQIRNLENLHMEMVETIRPLWKLIKPATEAGKSQHKPVTNR